MRTVRSAARRAWIDSSKRRWSADADARSRFLFERYRVPAIEMTAKTILRRGFDKLGVEGDMWQSAARKTRRSVTVRGGMAGGGRCSIWIAGSAEGFTSRIRR